MGAFVNEQIYSDCPTTFALIAALTTILPREPQQIEVEQAAFKKPLNERPYGGAERQSLYQPKTEINKEEISGESQAFDSCCYQIIESLRF